MKCLSRRDFLAGMAATSQIWSPAHARMRDFAPQEAQSKTARNDLATAVAGVRLLDSEIAKRATELARTASPAYLFNHAVRTFLFGSLIGRALGLKFDDELLYLSCVMHDLGLTEQFAGELPFEIQGAEAARQFLRQHEYPGEKIAVVWDGIAMHASMISHFKPPEIRLVGEGAGADVLGPAPDQVNATQTREILRMFPRMGFKTSFLKTCAGVVRKYPGGATHSFMRDIGERYVAEFKPANFCDLVRKAPFSE